MRKDTLQTILNIGIALSKEKDIDRLLEQILEAVMDITNCDAGTLYTKLEDALEFRIMITRSQGIHQGGSGDPITLPPVPLRKENVCACGVLYRNLINIPSVYVNDAYDFSGPKKYDAITGYHTQTMMVVPMEDDKGEILGVIQLINAMDEDGNVIPFKEEFEQILSSMGSQAAISMVNRKYAHQIQSMLDSFVRVMTTAIDERTPHTANHTKNMAVYANRFIDWLNEQPDIDWNFSEQQKHVFLMSVRLHDIGKLITPLEIMDKQDRLADNYPRVMERLEKIRLLIRIECLQGQISVAEQANCLKRVSDAKELINTVNKVGFLTEELEKRVLDLATWTYMEEDGTIYPWLTEQEKEQLLIRKGTLTKEERLIMQSHVEMTQRMLEQMDFGEEYKDVVRFASQHHERLDGSGYPNGIDADKICREVRLLVILDVFEALTARDRPYKKAMPVERAMGILYQMAEQREIDHEILEWFEESQAWLEVNSKKSRSGK